MTEGLDVAVKDRVCWITLDRPDKLNALTPDMMHGLRKVFTDIDDDPDVHVAVLRGAGEKGFCAGMDLDWSASLTKADRVEQGRLGEKTCAMMERLSIPIFAAAPAYSVGAWLEL